MHIFYTPAIESDDVHYDLSEEESKHCVRVLRLAIGTSIRLIDGKGGVFECKIADPHPKRTRVNVVSYTQKPHNRNYKLHIAIAPTKSTERFEWFLEKATEIGIDEITPIICEHSERKDVKIERLNKIIIAAMKQSQQYFLPTLNDPIKLSDFLKQNYGTSRFIAHCVENEKQELKSSLFASEDSTILIGPEGDFSPDEIALSISSGYVPITLGNTRLRTETAGVVTCVEVSLINR